jgi:hypothetical protein
MFNMQPPYSATPPKSSSPESGPSPSLGPKGKSAFGGSTSKFGGFSSNTLKQSLLGKSSQTLSLEKAFKSVETEEQKMRRLLEEQNQKMEEYAENMIAAMNASSEEEGISIDGISSAFAAPKPSEKQFQDQTAVDVDIDTIDDLDDLSMSILRPEIIARFNGNQGTQDRIDGIGGHNFRDLLDGNIVRDQLADDVYKKVYAHLEENAKNLLSAASVRVDDVFETTKNETDVLIAYRTMIDSALNALDLHECGEELGALFLGNVASILTPEDVIVEDLPATIQDLVARSTNSTVDVEISCSNTKLYFSLLASVYEAMSGYAPHLGQSGIPTGPFHYKSNDRPRFSIEMFKEKQVRQTSSAEKSVVRKGTSAVVSSILKTNMTKHIQQLLCCLSNELIVSGGINRLLGTELGNKYGVASGDPFKAVFGVDMSIVYSENSVNIPQINPKPGSLCDFITAVDTDSNRVVLPFEVSSVDLGTQHYLPGSSYMVEGPARKIDKNFTNPLETFNNNLMGESKSAKAYISELFALEETTPLAPQSLFIRILEDIYTICLEASKPIDQVDRNTILSAAKISLSHESMTIDPEFRTYPKHVMCAADIRHMIEVTLKEEEQPTYRASYNSEVKKEVDRTSTWFLNRGNFDNAVKIDWQWAIMDISEDVSSQDVVPIGRESLCKFEIDSDGETETPHRMILTTVDELMAEADRFAGRKGKQTSYLDPDGVTALSKLDYSAMLAIVYQLYNKLVSDLFHWHCIKRPGASPDYSKAILLDRAKNKKTSEAIFAILSTYKEGGDFSALFDDDGNALAIENVSLSSKVGKNLTMGQLIDVVDGLKRHRSFIKCGVHAVEAVSQNISQKSTALSSFQKSAREVLTNKVKLVNVKNKKLSSFVTLINQPLGKEALRGLTSMQASSTTAAFHRMKPASEIEKRQSRFVMTPGTVEALRIFHESNLLDETQNVVCVGLPNGMIDNLRTSTTTEGERSSKTTSSGELSVRFLCDNELYTSLSFSDIEIRYDSSLYILPDSYSLITSVESEEDVSSKKKSPDPIRNLVNNVVFYRIVGGNIIETKTGSEIIEDSNESVYEILKNHVFSDLTRISIDIAMGIDINESDLKKYEDLNSAHISNEGRSLVQELSKNKNIYMFETGKVALDGVTTPMVIDESTTFYSLNSKPAGQAAFQNIGENDTNDIKRTGQSCLFTAELDRHRIIGTSSFDRVFYVPVNTQDFVLDELVGIATERKNYKVGSQSRQYFDISGFVCDVRVS